MSRKPTKILHVVFTLEPGGMENGLVNVANALDRDEFEIHVCCLERGGPFAARLPNPNNVHVLGKQPGFSIKTVFALKKLISRIKPDVLHSHNLGPLIYASLATRLGRWKPILHGEHGALHPDQLLLRRILQRKFFYRTCRRIHTVSHTLTQQLYDTGFTAPRILTLINGVDTERFVLAEKVVARKRIGLPESAIVIGIVGRLVAWKRHEDLIAAFTGLAGKFPAAHLLIVGGGPDESKILDRINASPFKGRIRATGFQGDPLPFYQAMDLLATPSTHEGMSNVVLEAMSCGVPVLAHNICGNAEMISGGVDGVVAGLNSVGQLQAELEKILMEPEKLAAMGRAAREKVAGNFSLARMAANYAGLYRELSKTSPG